jgi:peptide methionine sulfoxide reductase msrA/msrB
MEIDKTLLAVLVVGVGLGFLVPELMMSSQGQEKYEKPEWKSQVVNETPEEATFAGGCFWCIEEVYQGEKGVASAISGFTDGKASTATYRQVASGNTEHREVVKVEYYKSLISYRELLDIYWRSIDPTDPGGQFADRGFQYTTAIYAHNERQYRLAKQSKENLSEIGKFEEPVVTEIKNFTEFYRAPDRHQNYSRKNSYQYKAYKRASGRSGFIERVWK